MYRVGQLAQSEAIDTIGSLEVRGSPDLHSAWTAVAADYAQYDRTRVFPGFRMWRSLVPAPVLLPELHRVMFAGAAQFETLADEYCDSDSARTRVAGGIRAILLRDLSYDARWRDFISHMAAHLGYV